MPTKSRNKFYYTGCLQKRRSTFYYTESPQKVEIHFIIQSPHKKEEMHFIIKGAHKKVETHFIIKSVHKKYKHILLYRVPKNSRNTFYCTKCLQKLEINVNIQAAYTKVEVHFIIQGAHKK